MSRTTHIAALLTLSVGIAFWSSSAFASTPVSGSISTQTWTAANSPYIVTDDIEIGVGEVLTIESGVTVQADSAVGITVLGSLQALGTETDSVVFEPAGEASWGNILVYGAGLATLEFSRISGGYAGNGGAFMVDAGAHIEMSDCVVRDNIAATSGGGLCLRFASGSFLRTKVVDNAVVDSTASNWEGGGFTLWDSEVELIDCLVRGNSAGRGGGGGLRVVDGTMTMRGCEISFNTIVPAETRDYGGGLWTSDGTVFLIENCTIAYNSAPETGGAGFYASTGVFRNSILYGNAADNIRPPDPTDVTVEYSLVDDNIVNLFPEGFGDGVFTGNPLFASGPAGDLTLTATSPCIDTGDPASDPDPDGSISDMGAYYFHHEGGPEPDPDPQPDSLYLALPHLAGLEADTEVTIEITGSVNASSLDMAFTVGTGVSAGDPLLLDHLFTGMSNVYEAANMVGDTVFVSLASPESTEVMDSILVRISLVLAEDAFASGDIALAWLPNPETSVDESEVYLIDGSLSTSLLGDASGDGTVSAQDASHILRYKVRLEPSINADMADVTGNGSVSSEDAACILRYVLDPNYVFPRLAQDKAAIALSPGKVGLVWKRSKNGWDLVANGPVSSGELTLSLADVTPVDVTGMLAFGIQEGTELRVAFARVDEDRPVLFTVRSPELSVAPVVEEVSLNEGSIEAVMLRPGAFSLEQNMPNPFNPSTTVRFTMDADRNVRLSVYNATGQLVKVLVDGMVLAGTHEVAWDGRDNLGNSVASGVYLYRLESVGGDAQSASVTRRMVLTR